MITKTTESIIMPSLNYITYFFLFYNEKKMLKNKLSLVNTYIYIHTHVNTPRTILSTDALTHIGDLSDIALLLCQNPSLHSQIVLIISTAAVRGPRKSSSPRPQNHICVLMQISDSRRASTRNRKHSLRF